MWFKGVTPEIQADIFTSVEDDMGLVAEDHALRLECFDSVLEDLPIQDTIQGVLLSLLQCRCAYVGY